MQPDESERETAEYWPTPDDSNDPFEDFADEEEAEADRSPLLSRIKNRVRFARDRRRERREGFREWEDAHTLRDLGQVTARWLEGKFISHPNGYDEPDEETTDLIPALAALNRAGFVTDGSQPGMGPVWGFDNRVWWQRAAVDGYTDPVTADRIERAAADAGLICVRNGRAEWRTTYQNAVAVTVHGHRFVDADGYGPHTRFGVHMSRRAVKFSFRGIGAKALCHAEQVTVVDPLWGRNDLLWPSRSRRS